MLVPRWMSTVVLVVLAAAVAAGAVVVGTAGWLFSGYRPSADPALRGATARSATWSDVHQGSLLVLLGLLVLLAVATPLVVGETGRGPARPIAAGLVALIGTVGAAVGALTTRLVAWDQVALRAVTVGTDVGGWRLAAFDDGVRFVLVGGAEVSQETYARVLVAHLTAPMVALIAVVALVVLVRSALRRARALAVPATSE